MRGIVGECRRGCDSPPPESTGPRFGPVVVGLLVVHRESVHDRIHYVLSLSDRNDLRLTERNSHGDRDDRSIGPVPRPIPWQFLSPSVLLRPFVLLGAVTIGRPGPEPDRRRPWGCDPAVPGLRRGGRGRADEERARTGPRDGVRALFLDPRGVSGWNRRNARSLNEQSSSVVDESVVHVPDGHRRSRSRNSSAPGIVRNPDGGPSA
jgi:hypothetical protein